MMQIQCQDHHLLLSGDITMSQVSGADFKALQNALKNQNITEVDLSGVTKADSACVSLLITALRDTQGQQIRFSGLPSAVLALIDLYELNEWITAS